MQIPLTQWSDPQHLDRIHAKALEVLERFGMRMEDDACRQLLIDHGCQSGDDRIVHFPPAVIERAVADSPSAYVMGSAGGAVEMSVDSMHFRCQSGCINVLDHATGQVRPAVLDDVVTVTKVIDAAEHLSVVASLLYPQDVPPDDRDVATVDVMLEHSRKHIYVQAYHGDSARRIAERVQQAGSTAEAPYLTFITGSTSPLTCVAEESQIQRVAVEHGLPVMAGGTPTCGATCPVTLAGQMVLQHAENLAMLAHVQSLKPGHPSSYGIRPALLDMRTANHTWGHVEWGMVTYVLAHLARRLGLISDVVGLPTDSKLCDFQAGAEKSFTAALTALSPGNMIAGAGFVETILTASGEQVLIDNELAGMAKRLRRGIDWDDRRAAVDLIGEVGPGGDYLTEDHTLEFFRDEFYDPTIFDRHMRHTWATSGAHDTPSAARQHLP